MTDLPRVRIDLNVRRRGNQTFTRLAHVHGEITEGQLVEVYEEESGVYGPGIVMEIDRKKQLVYLSVDWGALREPPS